MNQHSKLLLVLLAASSLALSACGEKKPVAKSDSQVAMKVNGEAVTVAELNEKKGHPDSTKPYTVSGPMMKMVISTELLHQAALQAKLDADPLIHARIANSTRMILATAYLEKQVAAIGKPTDAEVSAYFNQHPERYANRMQYDMQELSIQPPPGKEADIQAQAAKSKKVNEFEQWLTKSNIPYSDNSGTKTSDQIPDQVLQKLMNRPVGGSIVLGGKGQMNVVFVLGEKTLPITLAEAKPEIAFSLVNKRKSEIVDNTLKQLRDKAKIEYMPPYTANGFLAPVDQE